MAMNKKAQKFLSKKPSGSTPKSQMPTKSTKASKQLPRSLPSNASSVAKANAFGKKGSLTKRGKGDVSAYV